MIKQLLGLLLTIQVILSHQHVDDGLTNNDDDDQHHHDC